MKYMIVRRKLDTIALFAPKVVVKRLNDLYNWVDQVWYTHETFLKWHNRKLPEFRYPDEAWDAFVEAARRDLGVRPLKMAYRVTTVTIRSEDIPPPARIRRPPVQ